MAETFTNPDGTPRHSQAPAVVAAVVEESKPRHSYMPQPKTMAIMPVNMKGADPNVPSGTVRGR